MNDVSPQSEHRLSEAKRKLLENYLRGEAASSRCVPGAILPRPTGTLPPLSLAQEQLWIQEQEAGGALLYNESVTLKTNRWLDAAVLEKSLAEIVRRHEIWRTSYDMVDGKLVQVIHPIPFGFPFQVIDIRKLPQAEREVRLLNLTNDLARQAFDLRSGPLLRLMFVRLTDTDQRLFLFAHLSVLDGVSVYQIFPRELAALYEAFSAGEPSPLPELNIQYADYAFWERQRVSSDGLNQQLAYWREQLGGDLPVLAWPKYSGRLLGRTHRGALQSFALSPSLTERLKQQSRNYRITLFTVLVANLSALLHSYTRQNQIILGTPAAGGRKRSEVLALLGYFLNPVALRINVDGNAGFRELLARVKQVVTEALTYDDVPIEWLAQQRLGQGNTERNTFFSVAISLQPQTPTTETEWQVSSMDVDSGASVWGMYIAFIDRGDVLVGRLQYNPDLFESATITQTIQDLQNLMEFLSTDPEQCIPHIVSPLPPNLIDAA
jgi:surfactin family lipopeptide synthetase A